MTCRVSMSRQEGKLSAFWKMHKASDAVMLPSGAAGWGNTSAMVNWQASQLGQAQCLLKGQQGIRSGDASVPVDVAIGLAGLLGAGKRGQAQDDDQKHKGKDAVDGALTKDGGQEFPESLISHC